MDGCIGGLIDGLIYQCIDGWINGWTDGSMDGSIDGWVDGWRNGSWRILIRGHGSKNGVSGQSRRRRRMRGGASGRTPASG